MTSASAEGTSTVVSFGCHSDFPTMINASHHTALVTYGLCFVSYTLLLLYTNGHSGIRSLVLELLRRALWAVHLHARELDETRIFVTLLPRHHLHDRGKLLSCVVVTPHTQAPIRTFLVTAFTQLLARRLQDNSHWKRQNMLQVKRFASPCVP